MKNASIIMVILFFITIALASNVLASQIINYQGQLSNSDGDPVATGDYQITFTIYNGGGVSLWTSGEQTVAISDGLLNYNLGSNVIIPESVFENSSLYLGIKIGDDPEISPKTLLTSAPRAAVAYNLSGGRIETNDNGIVLKKTNGDSAMVFLAGFDSHVIRVLPPEPCTPPDPCLPAIELYANNENRVDVYYPGEEADAGIVQMVASPTVGGFISIHAAEPLLGEKVRLGGSIMDTGFVRLYGGGHATEYPLVEILAQSNEGGKISFFDPENIDNRKLLTMGSSPTEGTSIVGFNPQPEPPGMVSLEILTGGAKGPGGRIAVYNTDSVRTSLEGGILELRDPTTSDNPNAIMEINSSYSQFNMFGVSPAAGEPPAITMMVDDDSAKVGIGTSDPAEALHVIGNITCTGEMYIFTTTKLKQNINPIQNALDKVMGLNGVYYNYRYNQYPELKLPETDQVGLLAEDVEKVLPEIVHEDGDGNKLVAYIKLTPLLIEAIKEQQETINKLQDRIEKLENN